MLPEIAIALSLIINQDVNEVKPKHETTNIVVPAGHHAHRRIDGTVYTHGNENLGNAAAHSGVQYPWPRIAEAGQSVIVTQPAVQPVPYTTPYTIQSSCPGGNCPTQYSGGQSKWYFGKNLGW